MVPLFTFFKTLAAQSLRLCIITYTITTLYDIASLEEIGVLNLFVLHLSKIKYILSVSFIEEQNWYTNVVVNSYDSQGYKHTL